MIRFVVSWELMDDLEHTSTVARAERQAQFDRLRDQIEDLADRKFAASRRQGKPPMEIALTSIDLTH